MLNWEERFSHTNGPVREYRVIVDQLPPTPVSAAFTSGHLTAGGGIRDFPKARAFNNQPGPVPKERRKGGVGRKLEPIGPCMDPRGHEWHSKGVDKAGTRLVYCPHCKRATTAYNAGVILPYRKLDRTPVTPVGGEKPCTQAAHHWQRDGVVRGTQRIICKYCKIKSRALPAAAVSQPPCAREDRREGQ